LKIISSTKKAEDSPFEKSFSQSLMFQVYLYGQHLKIDEKVREQLLMCQII